MSTVFLAMIFGFGTGVGLFCALAVFDLADQAVTFLRNRNKEQSND
jgi:hypothetical protein